MESPGRERKTLFWIVFFVMERKGRDEGEKQREMGRLGGGGGGGGGGAARRSRRSC